MLPVYPPGTPQATYLAHCIERPENTVQLLEPKVGMVLLNVMFPNGQVDEMNLILFSTSGTHGTPITIEDSEKEFNETGFAHTITFNIIKPRQVFMIYGDVLPTCQEDFDFLKDIRRKSSQIFSKIGFPE